MRFCPHAILRACPHTILGTTGAVSEPYSARRRRRAARTFANSFPAKGVNGAARTFWMSPISANAALTPFRNPLCPCPSP